MIQYIFYVSGRAITTFITPFVDLAPSCIYNGLSESNGLVRIVKGDIARSEP